MPKMTELPSYTIDPELVVGRYVAAWSEPDPRSRREAITAIWAQDGVEFVEGAQFRGHDELEVRVAEAYQAFVASGIYTVASADDVVGNQDIVTFTLQLIFNTGVKDGEVAWAARVFLVLGEDGLIRQDYQLTVQPLAS